MHSFVSLFVCCLALLSVAAGAKTVKPVCKAPVPPQPGSLRIAVLEVSVAEGNKLVNSREYKKSGANNNFVDDKESMANAQHLAENRRQYCALHGCDCLTTPSSYPLLAGEQGRQKNPSLTEFPFVRAALPFYDWVYRKQADTVFVNFGISIESLVAAFPADAHFGYPITSSDGGTDSAWLVRNSPRGNQMIQEMTDLQVSMANVRRRAAVH